jgi:hypothetical protein
VWDVAGVIDSGYSFVRRFRLAAPIHNKEGQPLRRILARRKTWRVLSGLSALAHRKHICVAATQRGAAKMEEHNNQNQREHV